MKIILIITMDVFVNEVKNFLDLTIT